MLVVSVEGTEQDMGGLSVGPGNGGAIQAQLPLWQQLQRQTQYYDQWAKTGNQPSAFSFSLNSQGDTYTQSTPPIPSPHPTPVVAANPNLSEDKTPELTFSEKARSSALKRGSREAMIALGNSIVSLPKNHSWVKWAENKLENQLAGKNYVELFGIETRQADFIGEGKTFRNSREFFAYVDEGTGKKLWKDYWKGVIKDNYKNAFSGNVLKDLRIGQFFKEGYWRDNWKAFVDPLKNGFIMGALIKVGFAAKTVYDVVAKTWKRYQETHSKTETAKTLVKEGSKAFVIWEAANLGFLVAKTLIPFTGAIGLIGTIAGVALFAAGAHRLMNWILPSTQKN